MKEGNMIGTEKQIAWAEKIRANLIKGYALIEREVTGGNQEFAEIIQRGLNNDSAEFFIDNRDHQFSIINFVKASLYDAYYDEELESDEGIDEYIEVLETIFDQAYVILRNAGKALNFEK